jgi:flavodoxin
MKSIAIIYHSRQGHTQFIAEQIQIGAAQVENIQIDLFTAESLMVIQTLSPNMMDSFGVVQLI